VLGWPKKAKRGFRAGQNCPGEGKKIRQETGWKKYSEEEGVDNREL